MISSGIPFFLLHSITCILITRTILLQLHPIIQIHLNPCSRSNHRLTRIQSSCVCPLTRSLTFQRLTPLPLLRQNSARLPPYQTLSRRLPQNALRAQPPASQKSARLVTVSTARTLCPQMSLVSASVKLASSKIVLQPSSAGNGSVKSLNAWKCTSHQSLSILQLPFLSPLPSRRVAELEQENARLLALTQSGNPASAVPPQADNGLISEVEQLRAQLAAAEKRERELSAQLAIKAVPRDPPIKVEASEVSLPLSSAPRSTAPLKSGASLGLMVLLCALPTLLSMPMHSSVPTSFSIPTPLPASSASTFDYSSLLPHDYDWSRTTGSSLMDLDDDYPRFSPPSSIRKLEFADSAELGGLDISFDTTPANNGKIRVRIHPSSSPSSRATSPDSSSDTKSDVSSPSLDSMWSGSDYEPGFRSSFSSQSSSLSSLSSSSSDPFFGVGESSDFGMAFASNPSKMDSLDYGQSSDLAFGLGSEYNIPDSTGKTRRVRIALKSMPAAGGEGGEWEVQIC